jgi:hypothetical protein
VWFQSESTSAFLERKLQPVTRIPEVRRCRGCLMTLGTLNVIVRVLDHLKPARYHQVLIVLVHHSN